MENIVKVIDVIGEKFTCQDAILLKKQLNFMNFNTVVLDFDGLNKVPTTFFYTLLSDAIYENGREFLSEHLKVKNLSNPEDFKMVLLGTSNPALYVSKYSSNNKF